MNPTTKTPSSDLSENRKVIMHDEDKGSCLYCKKEIDLKTKIITKGSFKGYKQQNLFCSDKCRRLLLNKINENEENSNICECGHTKNHHRLFILDKLSKDKRCQTCLFDNKTCQKFTPKGEVLK